MNGMRAFTDGEISKIKAVLNTRNRCWFVLGIRTGFRITEIFSLKISDVFDGKNIKDSIHLKKRNTKGRVTGRVVPMHPEIELALIAWLDKHPNPLPDSPLFQSTGGSRLTKWDGWTIIKQALSSAGINDERLSTHSMRKHFIQTMYKKFNGDILKLQAATGHKSLSSLSAYVMVDEEEIWNAIKGSK